MNYVFIILIVFRLSVYSYKLSNGDIQLKIIGGISVRNKSDFPYQVSLRYGTHHICGGSIITENLILTAAHCCFHESKPLRRKNLRVYAGDLNIRHISNDTESRSVEEVHVHPGYDEKQIKNDIALWKVLPPFKWNKNIQPVEIASKKMVSYTRCNVSGWGITDFELNKMGSDLEYVEIPIVPKSTCRKFYPEIVSLNVVCAGSRGKDSCQGDSGGALVCNNTLTGVVSYGEGCGTFPGVYTDVYAYRSWIKKSIRSINSGFSNSPNFIYVLVDLVVLFYYQTMLNNGN